jgi:precorrin-6Y C5,15-methyltransferase (decarboxylating)
MFGVRNLKAVHGMAPAVFDGLPAPDAVFVGATDQGAAPVLEAAWTALRPGGQLVINVATLESLGAAYGTLKKSGGTVEVVLINLARGTEQMETLRFEAVNPTFLLHATKPERSGA